jgi:hypothetical protein
MTRPAVALAALLLGVFLAPPSARADDTACLRPAASPAPLDGGTGGTGGALAAGGIGGTGQLAAGGIGGTGALAGGGTGGTGIVGAITGFASVCVNGLEVHYDAATPISRAGLPASVADLALGQVLVIDAAPGARGLTARRMAILDALVGPVTALAPDRLEVMGQTLRLDEAVWAAPGNPALGATLRVAGFRDQHGALRATRVETVAPDSVHVALGELSHGADGRARLDGLPLRADAGLPEAPRLLARGRWDGQGLHVAHAEADPMLVYLTGAERIVAEGIVRHAGGRVSLAGYRLEGTAGAPPETLVDGQRLRVSGRPLGGDRLLAERIDGVARVERPAGAPPARPGEALARDQAPPEAPLVERPPALERAPRPERIDRPEAPARPERLERPPMQRPEIMRPR